MNHVLITKRNHAPRNIYHEPHPDNPDRPKCNNEGRKSGDYVRKDVDLLPNRRMCKQCSGEVERPEEQRSLYHTLENMDPEAI